MNTKTALQGTVTAAGPLVLAAGTAMLTVVLANSAAGGSQGQAALPRQTVTVTPPAAGSSSAAAAGRSSPSPSPAGRQVLAAGPAEGERPGRAPQRGESADAGAQGGSDPAPSPPASGCPTGRVLTVNLPLGALPCNAIQIGGQR